MSCPNCNYLFHLNFQIALFVHLAWSLQKPVHVACHIAITVLFYLSQFMCSIPKKQNDLYTWHPACFLSYNIIFNNSINLDCIDHGINICSLASDLLLASNTKRLLCAPHPRGALRQFSFFRAPLEGPTIMNQTIHGADSLRDRTL